MNTTQQPSLRFYLLSVVCLGILFLVGCSDKAALESVDYVLHNAQQEPVEALERIRSIDKSSIRGKHNRARYALAYSEALYYNRINSDCDTLVRPLFEYYHDSDNHEERARALYQCALVMQTMEKPAAALYSLFEAEKSLEFIDDVRLKALVYFTMGDVYGAECHYRNALNSLYKAEEILAKTDLDYHHTFTLFKIGEIQCLIKNHKQAEEILNKVKELSIQNEYLDLLSLVLHTLSDVYIDTNRMIQCGDIIADFELYQCPILFELNYYYICAIYQSSIGNAIKANEYIRIADSYPNVAEVSIGLLKYYVYNNLGNDAQALHWLSTHTKQQETLMLNTLELSLVNTQVELLAQDIEIANIRTKWTNLSYSIFIVVIAISLAVALYIVRQKIAKQQRNIEEYISIIEELRSSSNITTKGMNQDIYELFGKPFYDINNLCEAYYRDSSSIAIKKSSVISNIKSIIDSIKNDESSIIKLEHIVDQYYGNIIAELRLNYPRLNNKEIRYILYYLCGFSTHSICILMDVDTAAISRLKYKIKDKIGKAELDRISEYR